MSTSIEESDDSEPDYLAKPSGVPNAQVTLNNTTDRTDRMIEWNVESFIRLLKQIVARRNAQMMSGNAAGKTAEKTWPQQASDGNIPLDEVQEVITLPKFDSKVAKRQQDPHTVEIPATVENQLRDYVTCIAHMYRDNSEYPVCTRVLRLITFLLARVRNKYCTQVFEHESI